jgi:hypothetical protein
MHGARFVPGTPELQGWDVAIADAAGEGPCTLAGRTDRTGARVPAGLSRRDLVPEISSPSRRARRTGAARFRLHLVHHRVARKNRAGDPPRPRAALSGLGPVRRVARQLLGRPAIPSRGRHRRGPTAIGAETDGGIDAGGRDLRERPPGLPRKNGPTDLPGPSARRRGTPVATRSPSRPRGMRARLGRNRGGKVARVELARTPAGSIGHTPTAGDASLRRGPRLRPWSRDGPVPSWTAGAISDPTHLPQGKRQR